MMSDLYEVGLALALCLPLAALMGVATFFATQDGVPFVVCLGAALVIGYVLGYRVVGPIHWALTHRKEDC